MNPYSRIKRLASALLLAWPATGCGLLPLYQPGPSNLSAREDLRRARFGIAFQITDPATPLPESPEAWADLAKSAGARYLVQPVQMGEVASAQTSSLLNKLGPACKSRNLQLGIDYVPAKLPPRLGKVELQTAGREMRDLLSPSSAVGSIRLGRLWEKGPSRLALLNLQKQIHDRKPSALLGRARKGAPRGGEDFVIRTDAELRDETRGRPYVRPKAPLVEFETTLGAGTDTGDMIQAVVLAAGHNANLLMRVPLSADGVVVSDVQDRLREIGRWLEGHSETIFGATGGPLAPGDWGVCTHRADRVFLHYLSTSGGSLAVPVAKIGEVRKAYLFKSGASLEFTQTDDGFCEIEIPSRILEPADTIIVLETRRS